MKTTAKTRNPKPETRNDEGPPAAGRSPDPNGSSGPALLTTLGSMGGQRVDLPQEACRLMDGFNRADLALSPEFVESIRQHGVLQPVLVRALDEPDKDGVTHEIFAGARRWKANGLAGRALLPAIALPGITDAQARNLRLIENLQREGLTALDEARQYEEALATTGQTVEELAAAVGVKRSTIFERRRLLKAGPAVQQSLRDGKLSASVAGLLAAIPDAVQQREALKEVLTGGGDWGKEEPMSFRQAREHIRDDYMVSLKQAPFDLAVVYTGQIEGRKTGAGELACVGTCAACPRRSGNMEGGSDDSPDLCTDPPCFEAKKAAAVALKLKEAAAKGQEVHGLKDAGKYFRQYGGLLGKYVDLNERCAALGYNHDKNWRQTLGKHVPAERIILATDRSGEVHELLTEEQATIALKAAGKKPVAKPSGSSGTNTAAEKARVAKTKRMYAAADVYAGQILDKLCKPTGLVDKIWQLLADCAARASYRAVEVLAKRRGLAKTIGESSDAIEKWLTEKRTVAELQRFVVEIMTLAPAVEGYCEPRWMEDFEAAAGLAGVKLEVPKEEPAKAAGPRTTQAAIQKTILAKRKAKAKGKAKK